MASPSSSTPSLPPPLSPKPEPLLLPPPVSKSASPPKKPAPLPWTHPETLALIQAYQEIWYSGKKGPLKSFQWEEIAVTIAARCGFDEPSRTSTQCRHKIEKLRKRYRSDSQKPHPNSWQYFELMDQLERGPMPLAARPIAIVKSSSPNYANNYNNDVKNSYGSFYSGSVDYYNKNNNLGDGGGSDESDEEWNKGYGVETAKKNKRKSVNNNFPRWDGKSGFRTAKRVAIMNGKRKKYYYGDDGDGDDDDDDSDDDEDEDGLEGEEKMQVDEGGGERELAAEIRGFAERFMRMENKKIEMMRETERYWMEMEKKKMDMILENHRKIINSIGSAFGAHKKSEDGSRSLKIA